MLTSLLLAIRSISRNRVRAGLTVLGILIGVAALIAVTTLGAGVAKRISGSMEELASNALTVRPFKPPQSNKSMPPRPLTEADGRQIAREVNSVEKVAPVIEGSTKVSLGAANATATIIGTTTEYFGVTQMTLVRGEIWTPDEQLRKQKLCVVGSTVADTLSPNGAPLGVTIKLNGRYPCRVVGVLALRGGGGGGEDPNNVVLLPIGAYRKQGRPPGVFDQVDGIVLTATSTERAQRSVSRLLSQRHRIRPGATPDFTVSGAEELEGLQLIIAGAVSALLACVASVSLIVGGIGVMNIMLVSVAERTREIGIRISIGATSKDILLQFLVEAVVLTSVGGVLGLLVGTFGAKALGGVLRMDLSPQPMMALLAVGTSSAIGIFFGYVPARRAARLDPIEALRSD